MNRREKGERFWTILAAVACICGALLWLTELGNGESVSVLGLITTGVGLVSSLLAARSAGNRERQFLELERQLREERERFDRQLQEERGHSRQEREELRSTLAHGLRMPLSIIQGYADLLSGDMVQDEGARREYLEKITQKCQYMTEVLSRQFSLQDTVDRRELHFEELDLLQLIGRAAGDMRATAREHEVQIRVITREKTLLAEVDSYLIHQILFNLMENAIKYMGRPGSVSLLVERAEDRAVIRVKDDGMGLSPEETEHIFEHAFQGKNRTRGRGHGLYLVRQMVEAHGGSISAESAVGQGMGITISLPLHQTE